MGDSAHRGGVAWTIAVGEADLSDNSVLEHLRALRAEFGEFRAELRELRSRFAGVERMLSHMELEIADVNARLDRVHDRLD
jgi:predicted  nucleic acid-binding Zn-ribbon protein